MKYYLLCIFLIALCGCAGIPPATEGSPVRGATYEPVLSIRTDQSSERKTSAVAEIDSLSLDEAVGLAIRYNPELKASEKNIDVASARIIQAKLLPNPELGFETEDGASKSVGFGESYKSVFGLSQPIPLGGKIDARTKVAEKEREIVLLNYEQKLREIIAEVKKTFINILATRELVRIGEDNLRIARELFEATSARVSAQAAPETEQLKSEIALSGAEITLSNARTELTQAQRQLKTLLGNSAIQIKDYRGLIRDTEPDFTPDKIEGIVLDSYPALLGARKSIEAAKAQLQLSNAERYPDITIGLSSGKLRERNGDNNIIEWAVGIPLPVFDRNQGRIKESEALIAKSENEYENILNQLRLETDQAIASFNNFSNQVKTYKEKIIPQAEKSLALVSEGYRAGRFTYLELLDAQRTLTATREIYLRLLYDLNKALVDIERLTGKPIEQLK
jgi:cobalt-zinc-cadmium efflux system outer membrane protein